ncbi:uncharacterized protein N7482_006579 [Penicillium canariense]|uniref:Uncharacterized protein n=1 Tax=Penicillium canariense TaxID=189055 RepID=A0A9W9LJ36_9EURO|nr:uncharacterized protein N7482_006579 [Penicillium canariense]KAJ5159575.1 hypothetical protein N7482_006579 [Penicillium canariense]
MGLSSQSVLSVIVCRQITRRTATYALSVQHPLLGRAWRTGIHVNSPSNVTASFQRARGVHLVSNVVEEQKYRRVRLGVGLDLENAFQTLLFFMKNPAIAGQLRQLEVYGSIDVLSDGDFDFNIPPKEPRQLGLDDLDRLKMTIKKAGFTEGNEAQILQHILLQNPEGRDIRGSHRLANTAFKQAIAALLITISPNLESLSVCPVGEYCRHIKGYALLSLFRRANTARSALPYLQNLKEIIFLPDNCSTGNDGFHYNICENDHDRLNLVRRLPALESVSFMIASWNNEAGNPPPPKSANYSDISFTHSNIVEADLCYIIDSSKALRKFTYTIGGRAYPEGGKALVDLSTLIRSLWRHRHTLEELDLDVEDNLSWGEIYGVDGVKPHEQIYDDEYLQYEELWEGEMAELDTSLETVPSDISLMDFPKLKYLSLGVHTLCFLARGIGPNRHGAESISLLDRLPGSLQSLRLYGKGEEGDPLLDRGKHQPDLDVDALLETLVAEKDEKRPGLKTIEGLDPIIPRAKEVPDHAYADGDHPLLWKEPEDWLG